MSRRRFGSRTVRTSNEDKILFPEVGLTKGGLLDVYDELSPLLLPHLRGRPLSLHRFPDGVAVEGFYQKQVPDHAPDWIGTVAVELLTEDRQQELVVCDGRPTLAWLANQATVELHPWLSRADRLDLPDTLLVDLDPPPGADFAVVRRAALQVRELLEGELGLPCFVKSTGSSGLHVAVPLRREPRFDDVRSFARRSMDVLARRHPEELTLEQRRGKRRGRLYLDVGRNAFGQTAVAAWSVRARPSAPIAVPLAWREVEGDGLGPRDVTVANVRRRLDQVGDPWRGWRRRAHRLRGALERLDDVAGADARPGDRRPG